MNSVAFISALYQTFLGRSPEPDGLAYHSALLEHGADARAIVESIAGSDEATQYALSSNGSGGALRAERNRLAEENATLRAQIHVGEMSPFFHYNAVFDPQAVMRRHRAPAIEPHPDYLTNFLGVRIDPKFFPELLAGKAGLVEEIPIPANWHADIAEWGAALRAVDLARERFTVVELGCGWGCWMNNTGVAARRVGLPVQLIGIEGDEGHIQFAREAVAANGFHESDVRLVRGIAASKPGVALFPRQSQAGVSWGLEPIFGATAEQRAKALQDGSHDELPMIDLAEIASEYGRIDLLHVDIQGGEADLIAGCRDLLTEKVAYVLIGTHSRSIEGRLFDLLGEMGWRLEIERPALLELADGSPRVTVDGVHGWRNMRLLPED